MNTTPCRENPYLWTSDHADDRAEAAKDCLGCPVIEQCAQALRDEIAAGRAVEGVWAGFDTSGNGRRVMLPKRCEQCGEWFTHDEKDSLKRWRVRTCCSKSCAARLRELRGGRRTVHTEPKVCAHCGITFNRGNESVAQWNAPKRRFCSKSCASLARSAA